MALLKSIAGSVALVGAGGACYSPELRDCTVSCESRADCGTGQLCNGDHLCAAPTVASCRGGVPIDAAPSDAVTDDDAPIGPPIDAPLPLLATLVVSIQDKGSVTVTGFGTCDSDPPSAGHCMYQVPLGGTLQLVAVPHTDRMFDKWPTEACKDQPPTCTLVVTQATTQVAAKFRKLD